MAIVREVSPTELHKQFEGQIKYSTSQTRSTILFAIVVLMEFEPLTPATPSIAYKIYLQF